MACTKTNCAAATPHDRDSALACLHESTLARLANADRVMDAQSEMWQTLCAQCDAAKEERETTEAGFVPMPQTDAALVGFASACGEIGTALQTLRAEISSIREFCLQETTAHYSVIGGALSQQEKDYIQAINPFVPRSTG